MSLINVDKLRFSYDGSHDNIFEDVSFRLDTDWKLGFIGRNGRGKTTFLRILTGELAYSGKITASVDFEYFPFPVLDMSQTARRIVSDIIPEYMEWELIRELATLEIDESVLDRPFETLSNGERTKILLAALFLKENAFLLIDEPTNHLDRQGRELVTKYLNGKKGFILVSHDRAFLDGCVDHILSINRTDIAVSRGNFSTWQENTERRESFERTENEKLRREIGRLEKTAREKSAWSDRIEKTKYNSDNSGSSTDRGFVGHQSAKMMKRAKTIEKRREAAIEEKSSLLRNVERMEDLKLSPLTHHSRRLISVRDLTIDYGDKPVFTNVGFEVSAGDRIALSGKNGSGKSSILKLILGDSIPHSGEVYRASGLIVSYVPQNTDHLSGRLIDLCRSSGIDETQFLTILRKLDFQRVQFEKDISDFSAGQKKKVLIAKSLCEKAHLYIWDEPLNYIDVISRMQIEELLIRFKPTLLFIEHDARFSANIATASVELDSFRG